MHLQATASRAATLLTKNPALFCKVVLGKLNTARPMPRRPIRIHIGSVIFECDSENRVATAPMYFGSYAPLVVEAMRRILCPGDTFVDVGANIGYLSAVAANLVGPRGSVHCFEPVPTHFARLKRLAELNPEYSITADRCAVGDETGVSTVCVTHERGQSTLVPGYKSGDQVQSTIDVPVTRLDSYLEERRLHPALIKIDVEGFELPVLQGLEGYFRRHEHRPPILCEIAPRAYCLLGRSVGELARFMASFGYSARDVIDGETPVNICALKHVEDILFVAEGRR